MELIALKLLVPTNFKTAPPGLLSQIGILTRTRTCEQSCPLETLVLQIKLKSLRKDIEYSNQVTFIVCILISKKSAVYTDGRRPVFAMLPDTSTYFFKIRVLCREIRDNIKPSKIEPRPVASV